MATSYPTVEILVVDDHSTDGTGDIARRVAEHDPRVRVLVPPPLPAGWFGKSWACWTGAAAARGERLLFTDADTTHARDLLVRLVNAQRSQDADLISVGGRQEVGTFWERLLQPMVFTMLLARYGGTTAVTESRRAIDKIANGQCILVRRDAYHAVGGHEAVRDKVAEDLMLAQCFFRAGKRVALVIGLDQLSTRMYTSLGELVRGWRKNIFAGAGDAMPWGRVGRWIVLPVLLLAPWILVLIPPIAAVVSLCGGGGGSPIPPLAATAVLVLLWRAIYRSFELPGFYALLYPVGALVMLYIVTGAIARGRSVGWKGRRYQAG